MSDRQPLRKSVSLVLEECDAELPWCNDDVIFLHYRAKLAVVNEGSFIHFSVETCTYVFTVQPLSCGIIFCLRNWTRPFNWPLLLVRLYVECEVRDCISYSDWRTVCFSSCLSGEYVANIVIGVTSEKTENHDLANRHTLREYLCFYWCYNKCMYTNSWVDTLR